MRRLSAVASSTLYMRMQSELELVELISTGDKASHKLTEGTLALLNLLFKLGADHADASLLLEECIKHGSDNNMELVKRFVSLLLRQGTGANQPGVLDEVEKETGGDVEKKAGGKTKQGSEKG